MHLRRTPSGQPTAAPRRGMVLLAVLIVVVLLSLAAYQYSELMNAEYHSADSYIRAAQARAVAESGIAQAAVLLSNQDAFTNTLGSNPYENPSAFQGIVVQQSDNPRFQCRFSIVSPLDPESDTNSVQPYRLGVIDESGKLNLNALLKIDSSGEVAKAALLKLPGMTEELANCILDWIDTDTTPRTLGAEDEHYNGMMPSYRTKNGPLDSLDEMLLIKGMNTQILYGFDKNRNGIRDNDEQDPSGTLDRGLSEYLTIYSRERNIDSTGSPRIYINDNNLETLSTNLANVLSEELVNYILAYRMYGPTGSSSGGAGTTTTTAVAITSGGNVLAMTVQTQSTPSTGQQAGTPATGALSRQSLGQLGGRQQMTPISSLFDLINSTVTIPSTTPNQPGTVYASPLNDSAQLKNLLPDLLDSVTTSRSAEIPARVNVNTAPRAVLAALPGLQDADVQNILDHRPPLSSNTQPDEIYQTPAWLLTEANIPVATLKTLERYITTRSSVYRVQSIGYFDGGGPTARIEAVIDTNNGRPRMMYWRDLTELGKGFDIQSNQ